MGRHNTNSTALNEHVGLPLVPPPGANDSPTNGPANESDLDELCDYKPVPPQRGPTMMIHFRPGGRLRPLPYLLDEENP